MTINLADILKRHEERKQQCITVGSGLTAEEIDALFLRLPMDSCVADVEWLVAEVERLRELEQRATKQLDAVQALLARGKGKWPGADYVRDTTWDIWHGELIALKSVLGK